MKRFRQKLKEAAKDANQAAKELIKEVKLADATKDQRSASEAIKMDVRGKLAGIPAEKRTGARYDSLVAIHNEIEAVHDSINNLSEETGLSKDSAIAKCNLLLGEQHVSHLKFNNEYALFITPRAQSPRNRMS